MQLTNADIERFVRTRPGTGERNDAIGELRAAAAAGRVRVDRDVFTLADGNDQAFGALLSLLAPQATGEVAGLVAFRAQKPDPNVGRFYFEMNTNWTVTGSIDGNYLVAPESGSGNEAWVATPEQLAVYLGEAKFIRDAEGTVWRLEGERGGLTDVSSAGGKYHAIPTRKLGLFDAA